MEASEIMEEMKNTRQWKLMFNVTHDMLRIIRLILHIFYTMLTFVTYYNII